MKLFYLSTCYFDVEGLHIVELVICSISFTHDPSFIMPMKIEALFLIILNLLVYFR